MKRLVIVALSLFVLTSSFYHLTLAMPSELQMTVTPTASRANGTPTLSVTASRTITSTPTITATRRITPTATLTASLTVTATATLTATMAISPTLTPTSTVTPTIVGTPTPTPIRYPLSLDPNVLSITALRARPYGGSGIKIVRTLATNEAYRQVLIEYTSDGLKITGTMNIPRGLGPFPVVILNHGYFKPAEYKTGDGTSKAADAFARRGYLTIASDYRCYAGSQCAANPFYIGYAIDVLNLIAQLPTVPDADPTRIGMWGHSMGGGITLRVLAINDSIKVASLYGALTGDDEVHYCWLLGCKVPLVSTPFPNPQRLTPYLDFDPEFLSAVNTSTNGTYAKLHEIFQRSSPSKYLSNVTAAVIIHHGEADDIVPIEWSVELANALTTLGRHTTLYTYPGEGHVFMGWGWQLFMTRTLAFFDSYLKPRDSIVTAEQRVLKQERIVAELNY